MSGRCAGNLPGLWIQLKRLMMRHIQMIQEFQAIPRIVFSDEISASHPLRRTAIYKIIREILGQVAEIVATGTTDRDK